LDKAIRNATVFERTAFEDASGIGVTSIVHQKRKTDATPIIPPLFPDPNLAVTERRRLG
jgi:hypothetical protein